MIVTTIHTITLQFHTAPGLFSPDDIDRGTLAMLSVAGLTGDDKVLDLGCGYGVVGVYAAKAISQNRVVMSDVDPIAVEFARKNANLNGVAETKIIVSDGFERIEHKDFTIILSNPPYHADFSVPKRFIEKGFNRLAVGGRMLMVTKRKDWYKNKLRTRIQ